MKTDLLKKMLLSTLCVSVMFASVGVYSVETAQIAAAANNGGQNLTSRDYENLGKQAGENEYAFVMAEREATMRAQQSRSKADALGKELKKLQNQAAMATKIKGPLAEALNATIAEKQAAYEAAEAEAKAAEAEADAAKNALDELRQSIADYEKKHAEAIEAEGGPLFSELMWTFRDMDAAVAAGALSQSENLALTDYSAQADLLDEDAKVATGELAQTWNLAQKDFEAQAKLLELDSDVFWASYLGYHWWTLDYGLAREYALRPLEFGYFSYHSALNDPMGEFTTAERLYSTIFDAVSLGVSVLGAIPDLINQVQNLKDAYDAYMETSAREDLKDAEKRGEFYAGVMDGLSQEREMAVENIKGLQQQQAEALAKAGKLEAEAEALEAQTVQLRANMLKADEATAKEMEKEIDSLFAQAAQKREEAKSEVMKAAMADEAIEKQVKDIKRIDEEMKDAEAGYKKAKKDEMSAHEDLRKIAGIDDAEDDLKDAREEQQEAKEKKEKAQEELNTVNENLDKKKEELDKKKGEKQAAENNVKTLEGKLTAAKNVGDGDAIEKYTKELEAEKKNLKNLDKELETTQKEYNTLDKSANKLQKKVDEQAAKETAASNRAAKAEKDLSEANDKYYVESGGAQKSMKVAQDMLEGQKEDYANYKQKVDEQTANVADLQNKSAKLSADLKNANTPEDRAKITKELNSVNSDLNKANAALEENTKMMNNSAKQIGETETAIKDLQNKIDTVSNKKVAEMQAKADAKAQREESAQNFSAQMNELQPGNIITSVEQGGTSVVKGLFGVFGM